MEKIFDKMEVLINNILETSEFWKANYYLRSMKKAPHGGVFDIKYPNVFLKYRSTSIFWLFNGQKELPLPVINATRAIFPMYEKMKIDPEEILRFCFKLDTNNPQNTINSNRLFLAMSGNIITVKDHSILNQQNAVNRAGEGKITYTDNFDYSINRLISFFICTIIDLGLYVITDINEIIDNEILVSSHDKYGLSDVSKANFERQGLSLNEKYYLYNIFLDTSIGSQAAKIPKIIEIIQRKKSRVKLRMRLDDNLAVPFSNKVCTSTCDFQKWRGITLDFDNISEQLKNGKEVIVHIDPLTADKILIYVNRDLDENGIVFYHLNVEQLWNPDILNDSENIIITNYVHGTYYPINNRFEHIDYSVNQYIKDIFVAKYNDTVTQTGIPITKYGDVHYKIWCVEGDDLNVETWAELVCATLDTSFRNIFMEAIGGRYSEEE